MTRLIWIGDGEVGELSSETLALLHSGLPLMRGVPDHPAYQRLESSGLHLALTAVPPRVLIFPGEGPSPSLPLEQLVEVVDRLLGPGGCPWDQAQTHESLKKHLVEETYEVLEAIDSQNSEKLKEELGDLLLQPLMHAQMKRLAGEFDVHDVANAIVLKLVRRHPHVFGSFDAADADAVLANWDRIKRSEKGDEPVSILAGVPRAMPALLRAHEISKRAARAGFEWPEIGAVFEKLREEEAELKEALAGKDPEAIESEVGDLLFTAVNLARWAGVEPEEALRKMLDRFTARFMQMEAAADRPLADLSPQEWDQLWERAKQKRPAPPQGGYNPSASDVRTQQNL